MLRNKSFQFFRVFFDLLIFFFFIICKNFFHFLYLYFLYLKNVSWFLFLYAHFLLFLFSMGSPLFLFTSLYFSAFLCVSLYFSIFLCISLCFSVFLYSTSLQLLGRSDLKAFADFFGGIFESEERSGVFMSLSFLLHVCTHCPLSGLNENVYKSVIWNATRNKYFIC